MSVAGTRGIRVQHHDRHTTDALQRSLVLAESEVARLRVAPASLLAELDRRQMTMADGWRTTAEWTAAALDIEPDPAQAILVSHAPEVERAAQVVVPVWLIVGEHEDRAIRDRIERFADHQTRRGAAW